MLYPYLVRYRWRYVAGFAVLFFHAAASASIPLLIGFAVDHLVATNFLWETLFRLSAILVAAASISSVLHYGMRRTLIGLSRDVEYDLRDDLFAHLLTLSRRFYSSFRTGDLIARATNDIEAVRRMIGGGLMSAAQFFLLLLFGLIVMSATDWRLTAVVFLPLPLLWAATGYFGARLYENSQRMRAQFSDLATEVQENLRHSQIIRAFAGQQAEVDHFRKLTDALVGERLRVARLKSRFHPLLELLTGLTGVIVLWYGGLHVLEGEMSVGSFVMFFAYLSLLTVPMTGLNFVATVWREGMASLDRINELFQQRPEVQDAERSGDSPTQIRGDLEFRHVSHTYSGQTRPVLDDISFSVPVGQAVAILGATGSGKSTLVSLIPRLMDPQTGQVMIDGVDARRLPLDVLRAGVGFVTQDSCLFQGSIRENIAYGAADAQDWEVLEAAETACLIPDLEALPAYLDTTVGERGIRLSAGQKQRVALARGLLSDPRILILDDACSNLDAETEEGILRSLRTVMRNRTTLLISHRASAALLADRIIVLDRGHMIEAGTHEELLALGGAYCEIHRKQQLGEELERA